MGQSTAAGRDRSASTCIMCRVLLGFVYSGGVYVTVWFGSGFLAMIWLWDQGMPLQHIRWRYRCSPLTQSYVQSLEAHTGVTLHAWCTPSVRFALQYPERVQRHAHPAVRRRCKCRQLHGATACFQGRNIDRLW